MKSSRKIYLVCLLIILTSIFFSSFAKAIPPEQINIQGKLTDSQGNPINSATQSITFSIYTVDTGGIPIWQDTKTIVVTNGLFNEVLGSVTKPISPSLFSDSGTRYYLGIQVGTDAELAPRQKLVCSPMAIVASTIKGSKTAEINTPDKYGIKGISSSDPGIGVLGQQSAPNNMGAGVYGVMGTKIYNLETDLNYLKTAILGTTDLPAAYAGYFSGGKGVRVEGSLEVTAAGLAIYGSSTSGPGVKGVNAVDKSFEGMLGYYSSNPALFSTRRAGVWAETSNGTYAALGYRSTSSFPIGSTNHRYYGVYGHGDNSGSTGNIASGVYGSSSVDVLLKGALAHTDPDINTSFCTRLDWTNEPLRTGVYGKAGADKTFAGYFEGPVKVVGTLDATGICPSLMSIIKKGVGITGESSFSLLDLKVNNLEKTVESLDSAVSTPMENLYGEKWREMPEEDYDPTCPVAGKDPFLTDLRTTDGKLVPYMYKYGMAMRILLGDPALTNVSLVNIRGVGDVALNDSMKSAITQMNLVRTGGMLPRGELLQDGLIKNSLLPTDLVTTSQLGTYATIAALNLKADAATTYSKTDVDTKIEGRADTSLSNVNAATARTNLGLGSLATRSSITNTDIAANAAIAESKLSLTYSTSALNTAIGTKANAADVYNKTDIDNKLATKQNTLSETVQVPVAAIPNLSASKITSGTLSVNRIPDLDAAKITSGSFRSDRVNLTTGTNQALSDYLDYSFSRSAATVHLKKQTQVAGGIFPSANDQFNLGESGQAWKNIYATTGRILSGDLNEKYLVQGHAEDGDVMMIQNANTMAVCNEPNSTKVSGIFRSEDAGLVMSESLENGKNIVLVGKYPVKADASLEAIEPGDLLVSGKLPGYATKAPENPKPGTIIGKALENLGKGQTGKILVLVTLQ